MFVGAEATPTIVAQGLRVDNVSKLRSCRNRSFNSMEFMMDSILARLRFDEIH